MMKMDATEAYVYAQLKESLFAVLIYFLKKKICAVRTQFISEVFLRVMLPSTRLGLSRFL